MDIAMNFTLGLSQGIAWPWPIAVYLFLAGISAAPWLWRSCLTATATRLRRTRRFSRPRRSSALSPSWLGMICLVADLTNPLVFWRILIYYNLTSVMSLGVIALLFYIPLVFVLMLVAFRKEVKGCGALAWLDGIIGAFDGIRGALQWIVLILAITICAYTGFLISALIRFPLINTAVLPALFIASGLSAGAAAAKLVAVGCFGEEEHSADMKLLHGAEWPIMAAEALCIFMIAVSLISGNAAAQAAVEAFVSGTWSTVFWVGVVGVGFVLPCC